MAQLLKYSNMHAYIHTYIHTYKHTYIHTYIHTYMFLQAEVIWKDACSICELTIESLQQKIQQDIEHFETLTAAKDKMNPVFHFHDITYIHTYIQYTHTYIHAYSTYILTYIHACKYTYIYINIQKYILTYIPTYIHTFIHTYIHTCIQTYIHTYIHDRPSLQ